MIEETKTKENDVTKIKTIKSKDEHQISENASLKHSMVWGTVVMVVTLLFYLMSVFSGCGC